MADLVMDVKSAKAHRQGGSVVVEIAGESANSRDQVYTDTTTNKDAADVYVRVRPADGFGTQMTGSYSVKASIDDGAAVKLVRVHGRNGVKEVKVA
jgi:hypothetical protein